MCNVNSCGPCLFELPELFCPAFINSACRLQPLTLGTRMDSLRYISDTVVNMLDTSDYVILALFSVAATYLIFKCRSSPSRPPTNQISNFSSATGRQAADRSFLGRMKSEDRQVGAMTYFLVRGALIPLYLGPHSVWLSNGHCRRIGRSVGKGFEFCLWKEGSRDGP